VAPRVAGVPRRVAVLPPAPRAHAAAGAGPAVPAGVPRPAGPVEHGVPATLRLAQPRLDRRSAPHQAEPRIADVVAVDGLHDADLPLGPGGRAARLPRCRAHRGRVALAAPAAGDASGDPAGDGLRRRLP